MKMITHENHYLSEGGYVFTPVRLCVGCFSDGLCKNYGAETWPNDETRAKKESLKLGHDSGQF